MKPGKDAVERVIYGGHIGRRRWSEKTDDIFPEDIAGDAQAGDNYKGEQNPDPDRRCELPPLR